MKKSQKKEPVFKGAITAYLALLFILMLSVVGALVESVSIQMTKNRKRADMVLALESVFAEYDKQMLEEYDLFVRNGCSEAMLINRLEYYGAANMTHSIMKKECLTDYKGAPFREQAIRYAKDWLGVEELPQETEYEFYSETFLEEEELVHMDLQDLLAQEEAELPKEGNPLTAVQNLKNTDLITLVSEHPEQLSNRSITIEDLPSGRKLETGNWGSTAKDGTSEKAFLVAYLTDHFGRLTKVKEPRALLYEQEYLLSGYPSDRQNLEKVCEQILSIRMAANYAYLLTDTVKQAEAQTMALGLCALLTVPGIADVVKHAILLAWAYGESVVDVRVLLKDKKVPAIKTADTWQLQLSNLAKLGSEDEVVDEVNVTGGLGYHSYLTGLLLMEHKDALSMRSLDLIESNTQIQTDTCMTKLEMTSKTVLRRGIKDSFSTSFGYQ